VLRATTTAVQMAVPVRNILDIPSYVAKTESKSHAVCDLHLVQTLLNYTYTACCRITVQRIQSKKSNVTHFVIHASHNKMRLKHNQLHLHYTSACSIRFASNSVQITDITIIYSQNGVVGLMARYELGGPRFEPG
jgi:hypothetical protein